MSRAYVVMENDFPCGVCSTVTRAEALIEKRREHWRTQGITLRVYVRWYEFEMDSGLGGDSEPVRGADMGAVA